MIGDPLPVMLAFVVGWLMGLTLPYDWKLQIKWWLIDRSPFQCPRCKTWHLRRSTWGATHRVAGHTRVCLTCHQELYPDEHRQRS